MVPDREEQRGLVPCQRFVTDDDVVRIFGGLLDGEPVPCHELLRGVGVEGADGGTVFGGGEGVFGFEGGGGEEEVRFVFPGGAAGVDTDRFGEERVDGSSTVGEPLGAFEEFQSGRDGDGVDEVGVDGVAGSSGGGDPFAVEGGGDGEGDGGVPWWGFDGDPGHGCHRTGVSCDMGHMCRVGFPIMALSSLKVACRVCGEPAFRWCDPVGFMHVECVPLEWFTRQGWRTGEPVLTVVEGGAEKRGDGKLFGG